MSWEEDLVCADVRLVIMVGEETGDAGRGIFDGDLMGEGTLCERSINGCLIFEGDAMSLTCRYLGSA